MKTITLRIGPNTESAMKELSAFIMGEKKEFDLEHAVQTLTEKGLKICTRSYLGKELDCFITD